MTVDEKIRNAYLDKLNRPSSIVGVDIPRFAIICGEKVDLKETVMELVHGGEGDRDNVVRARALRGLLKEELGRLMERLRNANLNDEEAERLFHHILGVKRAIADLKDVGRAGAHWKDLSEKDIEDMKRWANFLRKVR